jgi:hypothetical protein
MIVLRPGDKVLVTLTADDGDEAARAVMAALRKDFPGVAFTILSGVSGIAVAAPD